MGKGKILILLKDGEVEVRQGIEKATPQDLAVLITNLKVLENNLVNAYSQNCLKNGI